MEDIANLRKNTSAGMMRVKLEWFEGSMESKKRGGTETESEHYSSRSKEKGPLLGANSELGKN